MKNKKINPRNFSGDLDSSSRNFLYRLFANQRFLAIIGLVLLVVIIFPVIKINEQHRLVKQEIKNVQKKINTYEVQNKQLQKLIVYLKSDQYLETQARINLNMKKPGEEVIVVDDQKLKAVSFKNNITSKPINNLSRWWSYFFN